MKSLVNIGKSMSTMNIVYAVIFLLLAATLVKVILTLYKKGIKEKFSPLGSSLSYSISDGVRSSWLSADKNPKGDNIYSRMETNVSSSAAGLSENDMFIFKNNKFSPECCPSTYTNSTGCACATPEQMKYLNAHGGNRTIGGAQSEY